MKKEKDRFDKRFDAFCWGVLILAVVYFVGRFIAGVCYGV